MLRPFSPWKEEQREQSSEEQPELPPHQYNSKSSPPPPRSRMSFGLCTASFMLALKCNNQEVLMLGMLKEFKDVFGPGNAEAADFKADVLGASLA